MSITGKPVFRALRLGLRLSLSSKCSRICSVIQTKTVNYYHSFISNKVANHHQAFSSLAFIRNSQLQAMAALSPNDPASFSRPEYAINRHVSLALNVDFEKKILYGTALLQFEALQNVEEVVLDVRDQMIQAVELDGGEALKFKIDNCIPNFGSKLTITLPSIVAPPQKFSIKIKYETSPNATALQWLEPSQTSGKSHPYMFSQCQPIHARSILPCQDTPSVKFTYDAEVTAPEPYTILMSAIRKGVKKNKHVFEQPVPIPSYLLAIAVGVLEFKELGPRSKVWAEKAEINRSAWEFADTEKYLKAAEKLCGPYVWTQYDLLVLPPSFPYGGMENPCLTFVTPTLLAGDKSQAEVIVHEIMHSWTGNLVTTKTFEHFWLNEGFTVYLERKVTASLVENPLEGKKIRDFQSRLGLQELNEAVNEQYHSTHPLTKLVPDLTGIHPDDAFSRVPYEKGSLFLRYLEDLTGGPEIFDEFIRSYLQNFKRKSLDTDQFKAYLLKYFKSSAVHDKLQRVDWQTWLYEPGMPPTIPHYDASLSEAVTKLVGKIKKEDYEITAQDVKFFNTHQLIHFLQELIEEDPLPIDRLEELGSKYNLTNNNNSEIRYRWLRLSIRSRNKDRVKETLDFVNSQGRMKYVRPIYRDLYAWEEVREKAIDNFLDNEPYMMHVSAYTLRKDLHLQEQHNPE